MRVIEQTLNNRLQAQGGFIQGLNAHLRLANATGILHSPLVEGIHGCDHLLCRDRLLFGREGDLLTADDDPVNRFCHIGKGISGALGCGYTLLHGLGPFFGHLDRGINGRLNIGDQLIIRSADCLL